VLNGIGKWDGAQWVALGSGMEQSVRALASFDGELYAGGLFITAGGVAARRLARWDGASWSPAGAGLELTVEALAVLDTTLCVGGGFQASVAGDSFLAAFGCPPRALFRER